VGRQMAPDGGDGLTPADYVAAWATGLGSAEAWLFSWRFVAVAVPACIYRIVSALILPSRSSPG
jgi:hypothetical protein